MREAFVGVGLERVSGEDSCGFAESDVAGGASAAEVVVVERGEIVVDERVGVEHLDARAEFVGAIGDGPMDHARGFHDEDRAETLASGEDAVTHGLMDGWRILRAGREQTLESGVGEFAAVGEGVFQHERVSITIAVMS